MANGEVLNPHDTSGWRDVDRTALSNTELIDLVFDWSPIRGHKAAVGAVGVKIISDQLSWPSRQQLPAELLKVPNLHVILLHRANALHAVRPLVRALAAGIWLKPVASKADGLPPTVRLDPQMCRYHFERTQHFYHYVETVVRSAQCEYEELATERRVQLGRICRFLGVEPVWAPLSLQRQESLSRQEVIENYAEIEKASRIRLGRTTSRIGSKR